MRKEFDRVYTVFAAEVMGWWHGTCDHFVMHFPCTRVHFRFIFKKCHWTN